MFLLLMRTRLLSGRNIIRDSLRRHPLLALGLSLLGTGLFLLTYVIILFVFRIAQAKGLLTETLYQVFYFLFLFLLAGAVPFVASTLLHSTDYTLLFSSPLPPRSIIAAKLLDATVTNSLQFTVLGIPAICAAATILGLSVPGWLILPFLVALFILVPALITALALLLALAALGIQRLRAAITILNAVMAGAVCITIVLEAPHLSPSPGQFSGSLLTLPTNLTSASPTAHYAPSGWFAAWLLAMATGGAHGIATTVSAFGGISVIVGGLFFLCMLLGERLLSAATVATEQENSNKIAGSGIEGEARGWYRLFAPPIAAIIRKDFKYLWRDSVLLSQLGMPLILFLVPFLLILQERPAEGVAELYPFAAIMTFVILFMQTSILSLSLVGLESRSFWLVLTSPNSGATLLWAKFVMSTLVSSGIGSVLTLTSGIAFGVGWRLLLILLALVVLCSSALCGLGVGISAALPRFIYDNPAHRVSAWALILGFFTTIGYLVVSSLLFGFAWLLAMRWEWRSQIDMIYTIAITLYLVLTACATFLPLAIGARRIEVYQWEH
jgi:ABC-2 type transport system permease protein